MKNLENYGVEKLTVTEAKNINGGLWAVALLAAVGAGMAWAFEKGEALGKAMA